MGNLSAAWGEYQDERRAGVLGSVPVPPRVEELLEELFDITGLPAMVGGEVVAGPLHVMQRVCDLANMHAKTVHEGFYELKDWLVVQITVGFQGTDALAIRSSWGMAELEVNTPEWGVSSYHSFMRLDEWDRLPYAGSWCGICRQYASVAIAQDARLQGLVSRMTRRMKFRFNDAVADRVNNLLEGWGTRYPLP